MREWYSQGLLWARFSWSRAWKKCTPCDCERLIQKMTSLLKPELQEYKMEKWLVLWKASNVCFSIRLGSYFDQTEKLDQISVLLVQVSNTKTEQAEKFVATVIFSNRCIGSELQLSEPYLHS
jgi:hypothetical protein